VTWALARVADAPYRDGPTMGEAVDAVLPPQADQFTASDPGG
jgi:hypothetical protein